MYDVEKLFAASLTAQQMYDVEKLFAASLTAQQMYDVEKLFAASLTAQQMYDVEKLFAASLTAQQMYDVEKLFAASGSLLADIWSAAAQGSIRDLACSLCTGDSPDTLTEQTPVFVDDPVASS